MLHFGTYAGFDFFGFQLVGIQFLPGSRPFGNEPRDVFAILMLIPLLNAKVPRIAEDSLLVTVQQVTSGHDVMNIGRRGVDAMDQPEGIINTNVHFHAEVPLVALAGLMHLRIAFALFVFSGAERRDDGGGGFQPSCPNDCV